MLQIHFLRLCCDFPDQAVPKVLYDPQATGPSIRHRFWGAKRSLARRQRGCFRRLLVRRTLGQRVLDTVGLDLPGADSRFSGIRSERLRLSTQG